MKKLLTCIIGIGLAGSLAFAAVVSPPAQPAVSAGGNSFNPVFSADGQKLVFVSHANNLVTNDDLGLWLDVFVRDIAGSNTVLVSVSTNGTGGANADANYPSASANGQFIAFSSRASNLVPGATNDLFYNIFVRDVIAGLTRLASVDTNGHPASAGSVNPLISADGRYVVFESGANNLTGDSVTPGDVHLYRRDLWSNVTVRASEIVTAVSFIRHELGSITSDGQFTAYSRPTNNNSQISDAFVHQVGAGTTRVSVNVPGLMPGGYRCSAPVVSDDGRYAAFYATPSAGGNTLALHHDTLTSTTLVISPAATNLSHGLQISANGQRVLFEYMDGIYARPAIWENTLGGIIAPIICDGFDLRGNPAMTPGGYAVAYIGCSNVYLASLTNTLASANTNGSFSNGDYQFVTPALSADGARVAFAVTANDLVPGDLNGQSDIFLRDVNSGMTELITKAVPSKPATTAFAHSFLGANGSTLGGRIIPARMQHTVSADGRFIVSTRYDDPSVYRDTNGVMDVFVSDKLPGSTHALSLDTNLYFISGGGGPGYFTNAENTNVFLAPMISADGTTVAAGLWHSANLQVAWWRGTNGFFSSVPRLINRVGNSPTSLFPSGDTYLDSLSSNGWDAVFTTTANNLTFDNGAVDNNVWPDVVLRRLDPATMFGTNYLVSVTPGNISGGGVSSNGLMSLNGRWVIFDSLANNLTPDATDGVLNLYARDLWSNVTHQISQPVPVLPVMRYTGGTASFSPDSKRVTYWVQQSSPQPSFAVVHDLLARTNIVTATDVPGSVATTKPSTSIDGRHVAFRARTANGGEIRVRDRVTGQTDVLDARAEFNNLDINPLISGDGRFVVYRAKFPAYNYHPNQILVRDRLLGTTLIVSANGTGGAGNGPSTKPVLAANGRTVVFQSFASDLVAGDFNDKRDLFVLTLGGVDSEPDGMDDDWEMAYFGTLLRPGTGDFDGDGASDLSEFLAGTDPTNGNSIFRVLTVTPAGGGTKTLFWSGNPTRSYRAEFKDDFNTPAWTALTGAISWNGTTASITDPTANSATNRFYRVLRLP
jgi:Tol biopolymer transport system component